jgi:hypothetical protein
MADKIDAIVFAIVAVVFGTLCVSSLMMVRSKRWRNSIRGLLFATALIALALYLFVSSLQDYFPATH